MTVKAVAKIDDDLLQGLDSDLVADMNMAAEKIRGASHRMTEDICEIGGHLLAIKERLTSGLFMRWTEREFAFSHSTAVNMMAVADRFSGGRFATVAKVPPSLLYIVAKKNVPNEIVNVVRKRVSAGDMPTAREVRGLVHAHLQRDKPGVSRDVLVQRISYKLRNMPDLRPAKRILAMLRKQDAETLLDIIEKSSVAKVREFAFASSRRKPKPARST